MDGILNIFKEKGFTSHDVVAVVRKTLHQKKVGHTGTLDPEAEGVLPICLGKGTKLADYIMAEKKVYRTVLALGVTTTTEDHTGQVLECKEVHFDEGKIASAVAKFIGEYEQTPPMYSAIKVNGKKLYELAREGKEIERKKRKITIYRIDILNYLPPDKVELEVTCSKGTYIRTLCKDIGEVLGCGGHMSSLLRVQSGQFHLENSIRLSQLKNLAERQQIETVLISPTDALLEYPKITVKEEGAALLHNGGKIYDYFFHTVSRPVKEGDTVLAYDHTGLFVGIFQMLFDENKKKTCIKPLRLL